MRLKKTIERQKRFLINFKVTTEELELIKEKAEKYSGGNISEWVRYSAIELDPKSKDLVKDAS